MTLDEIRGEQPNKETLDLMLPDILKKYGAKFEDLTKIILTPEARLFVDTSLERKKLQIELEVKKRHHERIFNALAGIQSSDNYEQESLSEAV